MTPVITVVLPVFAIVLAGYAIGRLKILGEESSRALNGFVYFVALPAMFFISIARVEIGEAFDPGFLVAFGGGLLATFAASLLIGPVLFPNRLGALGLQGLSAIFANTGFVGIPLLLVAFGEPGKLPGIVATVINGAVVIAVGTLILEMDLSQGGRPLRIVRNMAVGVATSPLVVSATAGLLASASGLTVPAPFALFCDLLSAAVGPCALFAMGLFIVGRPITAGAAEVGWIVALKLLVHPAVTWWLAYRVLQLEPVLAASAVILAALPTGALVFVLAERYGLYVQRASTAIIVSTLLSVVTLSILLTWLPAS